MDMGAKIGEFTLVKEIGSGAFGRVFQARDAAGKDFALKQFRLSPAIAALVDKGQLNEEHLRKRFEREVRYQSKISHPNVVAIHKYDTSDSPPYFVMELGAESLADELAADLTLGGQPQKALFDILAGLEAIHDLGIYHRDLKPQNVLKIIGDKGESRYALSDFGLITAPHSNTTTLTATNVQGGTPFYAAPELIGGFKRATAAADIYSFGAILHDIFAGGAKRIPYTELSVAGPIDSVVRKCTMRNPLRRYLTTVELRSDLYAVISAGPLSFSSTEEKEVVELLSNNTALSDDQWDRVFQLLDDLEAKGQSNGLLMRAVKVDHINNLAASAPDLLAALGNEYCEFVIRSEGNFDFDYCDVLSDKLHALFQVGETGVKAHALIAILILGASHNRWVVERRFMHLADQTLNDSVAKRIVADVSIDEINFGWYVKRVEASIGASRDSLHPLLRELIV
jgi:eukaryotic-like serine/threonine-protein kinase